MAKGDKGYVRKVTKASSYSGGGGRGISWNTWLQRTPKNAVKRYLIKEMTDERLDVMGVPPTSDMGLSIRQSVEEEVNGNKSLKSEIAERWEAKRWGNPLRNNQSKVEFLGEAEILLEALYSATRANERENLDEGEFLDDPVSAVIEGAGWGEEVIAKQDYRKHVNLCIDNSGSTHMAETGFCSGAMNSVFKNLTRVLKGASQKYEGISWGVFDFNRISRCHLFYGKDFIDSWAWLSDMQGTGFMTKDPLKRDAMYTKLAPLMEEIYNKEVENDLIGEPRLDIILTDGEFENQKDADLASEWQRKRGSNVLTYVLNLCPETPSEVQFPPQFRVIPLNCISESDGVKQVSNDALRNALYSIVIEEMCKF